MSTKGDTTARDTYSKRLNLLFNGVSELDDTPWETIFNDFVINELNIDPATPSSVDLHRLPQRPVKKTRPIIVKFSNVYEKQVIYNNHKNLKTLNAENRSTNDENQDEHKKITNVKDVTEYLARIFRNKEKS